MSDESPRSESQLLLKDYPMKNLKNMAIVPGRTMDLQDFEGLSVSGQQTDIHKLTLARLDAGDAAIVISHGGRDQFIIEGKIENVSLHALCLNIKKKK